jgi:hypothetical protein
VVSGEPRLVGERAGRQLNAATRGSVRVERVLAITDENIVVIDAIVVHIAQLSANLLPNCD